MPEHFLAAVAVACLAVGGDACSTRKNLGTKEIF